MDKKIIERVINETLYILETKETLRNIAKKFNVSKSTVHKDMGERLKFVSPDLFRKVRNILDEHIMLRHIKGGESTKEKYQKSLMLR